MPETFYETLGVTKEATPDLIRASYRRLVLKYHPDQAGADADVQAFLEVTKAYEVLSDPERRREYDRLLALRAQPRIPTRNPQPRAADAPPRTAQPKARPTPPQDPMSVRTQIAEELSRLIRLYGRGSFGEAEKLARAIVQKDARQATPYAVLGDIARAKGDIAEAARMYAYAAQMDPRNPMYQRKHEELLSKLNRPTREAYSVERRSAASPLVAFCLVLVAGAYVALAREPVAFRDYAWISTWTFGLIVMLFLSGVSIGAGLSLGGFLDRFEALSSNSLNRVSPALALASIAIVNFWAAILLYATVGARERSYSYSVTRLFLGVGTGHGVFAWAASLSERIEPSQVLIWGGNLVYLGAVCGWMVADTLRD